MCRGLALLHEPPANRFYCCGRSSHTDTAIQCQTHEDNCINLEIIIDDNADAGYVVELDDDPDQNARFSSWLTATGGMGARLAERVESWRRSNNVHILRWLLSCQTCRRVRGSSDTSRSEVAHNHKAFSQKIGGSLFLDASQIDGCLAANELDVGADFETFGCEIGGEWTIGRCRLDRYPWVTDLLAKLRTDLTLPQLLEYVARHPDTVLSKLAKENKERGE